MIVSHGLKDCSHIKIVSVIASFDRDGKIIPLYVRIDGNDYRIHNSYLANELAGRYEFKCEIIDIEVLKQLTLCYNTRESLWFIPSKPIL